jgi:hypothetical protein
MAEEDELDLDDDMDLGDDSDDMDSGDDFAGELDDMMGDDELGGDSDDSDGELDSFFEDLSSIEEMDDGDDEPPAAAAPAPAAATPAAPPPPVTPLAKTGKKGGKLKWILIVLLLLGSGGFGYYWFQMREELPPIMEEMEEPMIQEESIIKPKIEPVIRVEPKRVIDQQPTVVVEAPKPVSMPSSIKYYVQVATCSFEKCQEDYTSKLRRLGEPVFLKKNAEKYDFIELISSDVYTYRKAKDFVDQINRINKGAGKASIVYQSNGHRITMGTFTVLERAKSVKFYLQKHISSKDLSFNFEHVRKDYQTTNVCAGPYASRKIVKKVLNDFNRTNAFPGAFVITLR